MLFVVAKIWLFGSGFCSQCRFQFSDSPAQSFDFWFVAVTIIFDYFDSFLMQFSLNISCNLGSSGQTVRA